MNFVQSKRYVIVTCFLAFAFLLGFAATAENTYAITASAKATIKSDVGAKIRKSANTESAEIMVAPYKSVINITSEKFVSKTCKTAQDKWYYSSKYKGYIRGDLVSIKYSNPVSGTVNMDSVSVRKGAGTTFDRKYIWNKGKKVTVVLKAYDKGGNKWYKVKDGTTYSYVSAQYVTINNQTTQTTTVKVTETAYSATGKAIENLNARTGPKITYRSDKVLKKGTTFKIKAKVKNTSGYLWYKIVVGDNIRYVRAKYVTILKNVETAYSATGKATEDLNARTGPKITYRSDKVLKKGTTFKIKAKVKNTSGYLWYKIVVGNNIRYVRAKYVTILKNVETAYSATGKSTGKLNARTGPKVTYRLVNTLEKGTTFKIKAKVKNTSGELWYKITLDGNTRYVYAKYVSIVPETTSHPDYGWTTDPLNVRTGPGTSYYIKKTVPRDTKVIIKGTKKDANNVIWYEISYDGETGYVCSEYITTEEPEVIPTVSETDFETMLAEFPSTYQAKITALHKAHPTWKFKKKEVGLSWNSVINKQISNYKLNLTTSDGGYRMVEQGTFDFDNGTYYAFDGKYWVAASKQAVSFYMDPRNWLSESGIFMFENMGYDSALQKESIVKSILRKTAIDADKYAKVYMEAGKTYGVSPVYLATKTRLELGSSSYMVNGAYNGHYNVYNIGATDGSSAAQKGLIYAASGSSYLRPWNTLEKAIKGGAQFISKGYINNNQHTQYYERFNVLNGIDRVGTHQYATSIHNAATLSAVAQNAYSDAGLLGTAFTFEIPVYENMPSSPAKSPSSLENNHNFLNSLSVSVNGTKYALSTAFNRFNYTYSLKSSLKAGTKSCDIVAKPYHSSSIVTVTGNKTLKAGTNNIRIQVKSTSGLIRVYNLTVNVSK